MHRTDEPTQGKGGGEEPLAGARIEVALPPGPERLALVTELARRGGRVRVFDEPAGVLLDLVERPADAVVAPLVAPRLAGPTLCALLRKRFGALAPLVLVVGEPDTDAALAAQALEVVDDCLVAPTPAIVCAKLRVLLRARAARDAAPPVGPLRGDPRPGSTFGEFQLLGVLGRGSHGTVYEARRTATGELVALKLLGPEVSESKELLGRFLREVQALSEVRSPRVVRILGAGCEQGRFFLVMERVRGRPATELAGRVSLPEALQLARGVCHGLEALDARGLVHRDVKPANILVDAAGDPTLIDLGLAKRPGERGVTKGNDILGTAPYLAPEAIRGDAQDIGSDLYALGVTLWELLTGRRPFDERSPLHLLETVAAGARAAPLGLLRPDLPPSVGWLVARLVEPDPARRLRDPKTAGAAIEVVSRAVADRVEVARSA